MSVFTDEDAKKKWFVTGGSGFIGSHVVDLLVSAGCTVTVYDNLSLSTDRYIADYAKAGKINFIQANLVDLEAVKAAIAGHDIVWHLGANTDIPSGYKKPSIDLDNSVIGTWNVLEAMRQTGVKQILFASTGAVYGESLQGAFKESSGPLIPVSHYGAGKIACEAFICSFAGLYGIQAWIYRFGNVIGERTNHGIIYDFISKLRASPGELEVLGTGRGEKNYFLVEDCIQGMLYTYHATPSGPFPILVNLGTDSTSKIMEIAEIIIDEMHLRDVKYRFTGTPRGWPGDQPVVLLDTTKIHELGWYCRRTSNDAVRIATRRLLGTDNFKLSVETL
jgi:UDP-glucose 4-epimerase